MITVVPLLPGQSRDDVSVWDESMEYVSLGPSVIVGESSSEEEWKDQEGEEEDEHEHEHEEGKEEADEEDDEDEVVVPGVDNGENTAVEENIPVSLLITEVCLESEIEIAFAFFLRLPTAPPRTVVIMIAMIRAAKRRTVDLRRSCGRIFVFGEGPASCCKP